MIKAPADICPICEGTGWKTVKPASGAASGSINDRRVTRCDCQMRARAESLLAAARIPRRYEHCELGNFEFDGLYRSLAPARMAACRFVEEYPIDKTGLLLVGNAGRGKTHLAVGILKALIREKGVECAFYDYAELLKEIQESYNPSVETTELRLLRPVFETEVVVIDDLGSVRPTEWRWDTVRLILNTRYNNNLTTIITTNFADEPAAGVTDPDATKPSESFATAQAAARQDTLGDRIGERMRSRLHEMCRLIRTEGRDFREVKLNATITVACADCPKCGSENIYRRVGSLRRTASPAMSIPITCRKCGHLFHTAKKALQLRDKHWKNLEEEYGIDSIEWM